MPKDGGKLLQVFQDISMQYGHPGLYAIAKKAKIDLGKLEEGEYVAFFNSRQNHLKIAAAHNVIAHRRLPSGRFYDITCIIEVVRAFHNSGEIEYEKKLKEKLEEILDRKHKDQTRRPVHVELVRRANQTAAERRQGTVITRPRGGNAVEVPEE